MKDRSIRAGRFAVGTADREKPINATNQTRILFSTRGEFRRALTDRVDQYFRTRNLSPTGDWRMYLKTAAIVALLPVLYFLLVFVADSLLTAVVATFALSQAFVLVGLNIMHDGNHGSYSGNRRINRIMGFALDLIGGSNVVWRQKHNILHHTYTNIHEVDEDLHTSGFLRLSPNQNRRPWHRFQHLYALLLYGFLTITWVTTTDFRRFLSGRIFSYKLPTSRANWGLLVLSKGIYFGYMIVLPLFFHPLLYVVIAFLGIHFFQGVTLSLVFQLAHAMDENDFPIPDSESNAVGKEWAVHEVETTVNFAPSNRLATWYLGGLNFQIEHHLFPKVCHVHYPAISNIVKETCEEFAISYVEFPSISSALVSHYRHLRHLGKTQSLPC